MFFVHVSLLVSFCSAQQLTHTRVQTSVANVFSAMNGWPFGALKDSGAIFDKQKEIKAPHPVRDVSLPQYRRVINSRARGF